MSGRPEIPADIKRYVRQRCAFGCVICGTPFYHYDHVTDWAESKQHDPDEIALLCARHHDMKTRGQLDEATVRAALQDPFNSGKTSAAPWSLIVSFDQLKVQIGTFAFTYPDLPEDCLVVPLFMDDIPTISLIRYGNAVLFNLVFFDENNDIALQVHENELVIAVGAWDVEYVGTQVVVRSAPRRVFLTLDVQPTGSIRIGRGRLLANGIELEVWDDRLTLVNNRNQYGGMSFENQQFGVVFGRPPSCPVCLVFGDIPRYGVNLEENRRILKGQTPREAET